MLNAMIPFIQYILSEPPVGYAPPKMDDVLRSIIVEEGDTAELPCVASGHPLQNTGGQNKQNL